MWRIYVGTHIHVCEIAAAFDGDNPDNRKYMYTTLFSKYRIIMYWSMSNSERHDKLFIQIAK